MKRLIPILFAIVVITLIFFVRCARDETVSEGVLVFALDTRLPDRALAGIKGIWTGTGRGVWKQQLAEPLPQAHLLHPCSKSPWVANTTSLTHVVVGCNQTGTLLDIRKGHRVSLEIPKNERLLALSLTGSYAILTSKNDVLQRSYKIVGGRLLWTGKRRVPDVPPLQSLHFSPKGTALLLESGGWVYCLPALGQKATRVVKGRAVGWMPDGEHFLVYDEETRSLIRYHTASELSEVMEVSRYFDTYERPVGVSPSGQYLLSRIKHFDIKRFLPEVQMFRIRKMDAPTHTADIDGGWGVSSVFWLLE